jgi:hypothetical protein
MKFPNTALNQPFAMPVGLQAACALVLAEAHLNKPLPPQLGRALHEYVASAVLALRHRRPHNDIYVGSGAAWAAAQGSPCALVRQVRLWEESFSPGTRTKELLRDMRGVGNILFCAGRSCDRDTVNAAQVLFGELRVYHLDTLGYGAIVGGSLDFIKWIRVQGFCMDEESCARAAREGHFEILQWLRSVDTPWCAKTCDGASWGNHIEVLRWARAQGCPWYDDICLVACREGHLKMLKFLLSLDAPWSAESCFRAAMNNGHRKMAKWIAGRINA